MNPTELIDRYCAAWNDPDATRRAAILDEVWADGASYTDPSVHAAGSRALLAHIAGVQGRRPGGKVVRTSAVDLHHGIARFAWCASDATGATLVEGIDLAFVSANGAKIERIIGFFGPLAPLQPA
jgi:hypothetical protein